MTEKVVTTTVEILGKLYPIRCPESELASLQQAAVYLNKKMAEVQDSGKAINLERIAIISALNIAHEFLIIDTQKNSMLGKINQRITQLHEKVENAMRGKQGDLLYTPEII